MQQVNFEKLELYFSGNVSQDLKSNIKVSLGMSEMGEENKYLGLPLFLGRSKKDVLELIKKKVWNKVNGWKEKLLSQAGREVLIK